MSGENIMRLFNDCMTGGRVRPLLKIITKTSAYTITPDDFGSVQPAVENAIEAQRALAPQSIQQIGGV